eukprot:9473886-Pyramimonas_sp.AAC.1
MAAVSAWWSHARKRARCRDNRCCPRVMRNSQSRGPRDARIEASDAPANIWGGRGYEKGVHWMTGPPP